MHEKILILDCGSQYTRLIGRKLRELNIYCEIHSFANMPETNKTVKGIIISCSREFSDVNKIDSIRQLTHKKQIPALKINFTTTETTSDKLNKTDDFFYEVSLKTGTVLSDTLLQTLKHFSLKICNCEQTWTPAFFAETTVNSLKQQLGDEKVVLGLSGGVDSTVAGVLLNKAIGKNLNCIFVDNGLLRKNEFESVLHSYRDMGLNVIGVDAGKKFLKSLKGVTDPEQKRKIIGHNFIEVFDAEAKKIKDAKWLAQGTIYPDVIESVTTDGQTAVKSHHNVGGLPEQMNLKVVEPLRLLFKDEVRRIGRELKIKDELLMRHPFPGPGLGIRIIGEVTPEKVKTLQEADAIFINGLKRNDLYDKVWQAGVILLPVQSVGTTGSKRTYESTVALRAVSSVDGMTANWVHLPYNFLAEISNEIIKNVKGINRVVFDISSKPPATIEWE